MPRKKKEPTIRIPDFKKQPGFFTIYIKKDSELKLVATNLNTESFLDLYFTNLVKNITLNTTKEQVLTKYNEIWKSKGIYIVYTDSWGHKWENQIPSNKKFDEYLNRFIKDATDSK